MSSKTIPRLNCFYTVPLIYEFIYLDVNMPLILRRANVKIIQLDMFVKLLLNLKLNLDQFSLF